MKFGAFVELAPGIEGLVHISEMSYTQRVHRPEDIVRVGETIPVLIKDCDRAKRRIALSIKEIEGDPWARIHENFRIGQKVEGRLEKRESFGCFVNLKPGITGLFPKSKIASSGSAAVIDKMKEGQRIPVLIESINPAERKISLAPADTDDETDWQKFSDNEATTFGDLGEKLQQALKNKDQ